MELPAFNQPTNNKGKSDKKLNEKVDDLPNTFVLYRIIGNDLHPRHRKGQALSNLKFVLENESILEGCEKRWIVNRIIDHEKETEIIELLKTHKQPFIYIPFRDYEYKEKEWDIDCLPEVGYLSSEKYVELDPEQKSRLIAATYRHKNNYVMNNNGARNVALRDGKQYAKWVLPWDGNCFVTPTAWREISEKVISASHLKYFAVPMTRVINNNDLLSSNFRPDPVEEPQLIFRYDSSEEFNEEFYYGRRPKVELFWRLGIQGNWDRWKDNPWDLNRGEKSSEAGQFAFAGWVARMYSGMKELEGDDRKSFKDRGKARLEAVISTIRNIEIELSTKNDPRPSLSCFHEDVLAGEKLRFKDEAGFLPIDNLVLEAEEALTRGPYSVIDKQSLPPSGNIQDYWHPAPYWWPNSKTADGLPYIRKDGKRVPGTRLYEPESELYDRSRLQRVFDDSITLALASYFTDEKKYANFAVQILDRFFINESTRMNPHLNYAQVRMGRNNNVGSNTGIIEMKDMYFFLDAVKLIYQQGVLEDNLLRQFNVWLTNYLDWLLYSKQGKRECNALNNHGTYYDLQVAAIADFLNNHDLLFETIVRAQGRISQQFSPKGEQPHELKRNITAHYCCYNFQGWISLATLASRWGTDLWTYKATNGSSLITGAKWLLSFSRMNWPFEQINAFDSERFLPISFAFSEDILDRNIKDPYLNSKYDVKSRFDPHDGIRPYWNLGSKEVDSFGKK